MTLWWKGLAAGLAIGAFAGATAAMQAGPETVVGSLVQARADENAVRVETWMLQQRLTTMATSFPCTIEDGELVLRAPLPQDEP